MRSSSYLLSTVQPPQAMVPWPPAQHAGFVQPRAKHLSTSRKLGWEKKRIVTLSIVSMTACITKGYPVGTSSPTTTTYVQRGRSKHGCERAGLDSSRRPIHLKPPCQ